MREPLANLIVRRTEMPPEPKWAKYQPEFFIGKNVKIAFERIDPVGTFEYMWVAISEVKGKTLKGKLDNDPICQLKKELYCGDSVKVKLTEIIQVYDKEFLTP